MTTIAPTPSDPDPSANRSLTEPFFQRIKFSNGDTASEATEPLTVAEREAWAKAEPQLEEQRRLREEREKDRATALELLATGDHNEIVFLQSMRNRVAKGEILSNNMVGAIIDLFAGIKGRPQRAARLKVQRKYAATHKGSIPVEINRAREAIKWYKYDNKFILDLKARYDKSDDMWWPTMPQAEKVLEIRKEEKAQGKR